MALASPEENGAKEEEETIEKKKISINVSKINFSV